MTSLPIVYGEAAEVLKQTAFHFKKAGPHSFDMTTQKYAKLCQDIDRVRELVEAIVAHKARGAAR